MNLRTLYRYLALGAAALVVSLGSAGTSGAADQTPPPPPPPPPAVADPGCPTCTVAATGAPCTAPGCTTCKKVGIGHKPCKPYVTNLRPGACFGYFQTQWHRWEDVCPIPYQGVGIVDAPPRPTPPLVTSSPVPVAPPADPKAKGSDAPLPKPPLSPDPAPKPPTPAPGTLPIPPVPSKF